jgi:hypothetical protein
MYLPVAKESTRNNALGWRRQVAILDVLEFALDIDGGNQW